MSSESQNSNDETNPNFLFGLLAINQGLVNGPRLADALARCDEGHSVAMLLVETGCITEEQSQRISALMDQYTRSADGSIRSLLSEVLSKHSSLYAAPDRDSEDPNRTIIETSEAANEVDERPLDKHDTVQSLPAGMSLSPSQLHRLDRAAIPAGERYRFVKELRRGGLGVVSVAKDGELNREVALKRIRPEKAFQNLYRDKFLREAEITGNLEHPGIVPVYGMGTDSLGHLFYAMRLIRGDTLSDLIELFWRVTSPGASAFYEPQLVKLIDHFLAACQTINYAHRRGVLHRDLKPDNVMVGSYGETIVVDWGLAKVVAEDAADDVDSEDSGLAPPQITQSATSTQFGVAMGTPAYASPEMISGRILDIDQRSDVYGLGSILFQILTGLPPVQGSTVPEVKQRAAEGKVTPIKLLRPAAPKPLAAICMKCLQADPDDRYQTVADLIDDLTCWKADQPIAALPDDLVGRTSRWFRHNRGIARSSIAALATGLIVAMLGGLMLYGQKQRYARLATENAELAETETQLRSEAQAVQNLLVSTFRSPDPRFDGHVVTVSELLDRTAGQIDASLEKNDRTRGAMHLAIGRSYLGMGQPMQAVLVLRKATELYRSTCGEQARETLDARDVLAEALLSSGSVAEAERQLQQTLSDRMKLDEAKKLNKESLSENEGIQQTKILLARCALASGDLARAREMFQALSRQMQPPQKHWLLVREGLAKTLLQQGEVVAARQTLVEVCDRLTRDTSESQSLRKSGHPDTLRVRTALAQALHAEGKASQAAEIYRDIIARQTDVLGPDHIETVASQNNLAFAIKDLGELEEASALFARSHKRFVNRLGPIHPHSLITDNNYAETLVELGKPQAAISILLANLEQFENQNAADHPDLLIAKHNLAAAYFSLGDYDKATSLFQAVIDASSSSTTQLPVAANSQIGLADILIASSSFEQARPLLANAQATLSKSLDSNHRSVLKCKVQLALIDAYQQQSVTSIDQLEKLVSEISNQLGAGHIDSLASVNRLAIACIAINANQRAIDLLEPAVKVAEEKLGTQHPQALAIQINLAYAMCRGEDKIKGIPNLERLVTLSRKQLGRLHPTSLRGLLCVTEAYNQIGWAQQSQAEIAKAAAESRATLGDTHRSTLMLEKQLAATLLLRKDFSSAAELYRSVLQRQRESKESEPHEFVDTQVRLARCEIAQDSLVKGIEILKSIDTDALADSKRSQLQKIVVLSELARAFDASGEADAAVKTLNQAWEAANETLEKKAPQILAIAYDLAVISAEQGDHRRAVELLEQRDRTLSEHQASNVDRFPGRIQLAVSMNALERYAEAEAIFKLCEPIASKHFANSWQQAWLYAGLGKSLAKQDRRDDAIAAYQTSSKILTNQDQKPALPKFLIDLPATVSEALEKLKHEDESESSPNE